MRGLYFALPLIAVMTGGAHAADNSVAAYLAKTKSLSLMNQAMKDAGLDGLLSGKEPITLLVPTDQALKKLPPAKLNALLHPANKNDLKTLMMYHIIKGRFSEASLRKSIRDANGWGGLTTVSGEKIGLTFQGYDLWLWDKSTIQTVIVLPEHKQSNGVVYTVDKLMRPKAN